MDKIKFDKAKELEDKIKKTQEDISDLKYDDTVIAIAKGEGSMYRGLQSLSDSLTKELILQELYMRLERAEQEFENL